MDAIIDFCKKWIEKLADFGLARILPALILLAVGILVVRLAVKAITATLGKAKLDPTVVKLCRSVLNVALYALLLLMVASRLGIDVTGIVALASVLTLAVSLSVQTALTNLISGFTLLNTKPFVAGDFVEIAGQSGTVRDVGLTYTKLATADNKLVSIPNSAVTAAQIVNYTTMGTRRVEISVSASYDTPVELVLEALREAAQLPMNLQEPAPVAAVRNYGESAIEYVLFVWCKGEDYWTSLFETNKNIKVLFDQKNVVFTYPHLTVHMDK